MILGSGLAVGQAVSHSAGMTPKSRSARRRGCLDAEDTTRSLAGASSLLEQNRFADAAALLRSQGQERCDFRSDLLLAAAFEGQGDRASAEQVLRQALLVWPSNTSLATSLARDQLQDGDLTGALHAISHCAPTRRTPQPELRIFALVYLENHKLKPAAAVAQLAWQAEPSQENLLFLANVLQLQGRYMDVVSLLEKHRSAYGDSAEFLITIGESESDGQLYPQAKRDLQRAADLRPDSYPAHYALGNVLVSTGDIAGGIAEYQKAIALSPQQPRTYYQLGRALEQKNDPQQAQQYFQQAISIDPKYAPAWAEMGKLQFRASHFSAAVESLTHAIQMNPASQESYYFLVQAYGRLGERDKAQAVMSEWTAFKKAHPLRPVGSRPDSPATGPTMGVPQP